MSAASVNGTIYNKQKIPDITSFLSSLSSPPPSQSGGSTHVISVPAHTCTVYECVRVFSWRGHVALFLPHLSLILKYHVHGAHAGKAVL